MSAPYVPQTARDICTYALQLNGLVQQGRAPKAYDADFTFNAMKLMLQAWSTRNLIIFATQESVYNLNGGQKTYLWGPTGDFVDERPMELMYAFLRFPSGASNQPIDYPLQILNTNQRASIPIKDVQSNIPTTIYYNPTTPNATLELYPVPSASYQLVLWTKQPLDAFSSLSDTIQFPRGYDRAIAFNLGLEISGAYNKDFGATNTAIAAASLADIQRRNWTPTYLKAEGMYSTRRPQGQGPSPVLNMDWSR